MRGTAASGLVRTVEVARPHRTCVALPLVGLWPKFAPRQRTPAGAQGVSELPRQEIHLLRGQRVLLDSSLATLYGVSTSHLNFAVQRKRKRFPPDFMFRLTAGEAEFLRSHFVISKTGRGGRRYLPYAFTEMGVAMLSSVLRSETAIRTNIAIMRAFIHLRQLTAEDASLRPRIERLERSQQHVAGVLEFLIGEIRGARRVRHARAIGFAAGR